MPYPDVESLPPAVKKLPAKKQSQWMHVWNSTFETCQKAGESECEEKAFASAWGVVKKEYEEEGSSSNIKVDTLVKIIRSAPSGLLYGVVYEPNAVDLQGDFTSSEEIEKAAHDFLPNAVISLLHKKDLEDVQVVESFVAPCDYIIGDQLIQKGSWVLVTRILNEELKKMIEDGEINAYSLEGTAGRLDVL